MERGGDFDLGAKAQTPTEKAPPKQAARAGVAGVPRKAAGRASSAPLVTVKAGKIEALKPQPPPTPSETPEPPDGGAAGEASEASEASGAIGARRDARLRAGRIRARTLTLPLPSGAVCPTRRPRTFSRAPGRWQSRQPR